MKSLIYLNAEINLVQVSQRSAVTIVFQDDIAVPSQVSFLQPGPSGAEFFSPRAPYVYV